MSLRAMTWALEEAPVTDPTHALVLVALADRAGADGRGAYPAQAWIAKRARVGERSVRRVLQALEAGGLIVRGDQRLVDHYPTDRRPVVWDLAVDGGTPATGRQRPPVADRGVIHDRSSVTERGDVGDRAGGRGRPERGDVGVLQTVLPPTEVTVHEPSSTRVPRSEARGTRVPEDFTPTPDLVEWARAKAPGTSLEDHERFMDYWRGVPGARGRKADWPATWRNWMARTSTDRQARQIRTGGRLSPKEQLLATTEIGRQLQAEDDARATHHQLEIGGRL